MNDIFSKDLSGEMVSPNEDGYDMLIDEIFPSLPHHTLCRKLPNCP